MKKFSPMILLVLLVLVGCAPAATPTQIASATRSQSAPAAPAAPAPPVLQPAPVYEAPAAPAATSAPAAPAPADGYPSENPPAREQPANGRTNTLRDHLSTFGLDVDTASYTQARQAILSGVRPEPDSIRVEEFTNFFNQDYAAPRDTAFGIFADGAPSPYAEDGMSVLRIGIQGYREDSQTRKPRHLTFVVDASGSMGEPGKLDLVKQTLDLLLSRLDSRDTVAVAAYDDQAWVVVEPTNASHRGWIQSQLDQLWPGQSTDLAQGLTLGYQLAQQSYRKDAVNRVILCTDGVANTGDTDPNSILNTIREYAGKDITLTALGFGMGEYNDQLLEQLADKGNGNYAYIDNIDEAQRLFIEKLASTLDVIALNAKVQVDFNPDVVRDYRPLGYEDRAIADQNFRNDSVDAGEIGAGHSVTALYEIHLKPGAAGRIATVQMRWEDPRSHQVSEINGNFNTWDLANTYQSTSIRYQQDMIAAYFAGILKSAAWARQVSWERLYQDAWRVASQLPEDQDVQDLYRLIYQARQME